MTQLAEPTTDLRAYARKCYQAGHREELAKPYRLSAETLGMFGVGYDESKSAFTVPTFDEKRQMKDVVLHYVDSDKHETVNGEARSVFMPGKRFPHSDRDFLFVCESLIDAATAIEAGWNAVGKVRDVQDTTVVADLLDLERFKGVIICHDRITRNPWGRLQQTFEAEQTATMISMNCPTIEFCKVIEPPDGYTTLQSILKSGGDKRQTVMDLATNAPEWAQKRKVR